MNAENAGAFAREGNDKWASDYCDCVQQQQTVTKHIQSQPWKAQTSRNFSPEFLVACPLGVT